MREILHRGFYECEDGTKIITVNDKTICGEWVCGYYIHLDNNRGKVRDRIYSGDAETDCDDFYPEWYDVIPETVGQCVCVPDKNGKKIFEGDLLESRKSENSFDWKIWKVVFEDGSFGFESVKNSVKSRRKHRCETNLVCADEVYFYGLVIVGNIHDNPELLNEKRKESES